MGIVEKKLIWMVKSWSVSNTCKKLFIKGHGFNGIFTLERNVCEIATVDESPY